MHFPSSGILLEFFPFNPQISLKLLLFLGNKYGPYIKFELTHRRLNPNLINSQFANNMVSLTESPLRKLGECSPGNVKRATLLSAVGLCTTYKATLGVPSQQ